MTDIKYNIEFYNCPSQISNEKNIEIVSAVLKSFGDDAIDFDMQDLLLYFALISSRPGMWFGRLATMKFKGTPDHTRFFKFLESKKNIEIPLPDLRRYQKYKYFIFLSSDIRNSDSNIFKVHTIAHEFQHVFQNIHDETLLKKASILTQYFNIEDKWSNEIYRDLPIEYDAFLSSKKINYDLYGKDAVDNFFVEKIMNSSLTDKSYWEFVDSIDVNINYDLDSEMNKLWKIHVSEIKDLYNSVSGIKDPKYKEFIDSYKYLIQTHEP